MEQTYQSLKPQVDLAVVEVTDLLRQKLSDNSERLAEQIRLIEVHHDRISTLLTEAESVLTMAKDFSLPERERKFNEFDKKIIIGAKVSKEQEMVSLLERKLDSIEKRIQTAQSLLAYSRELAKIGGREQC